MVGTLSVDAAGALSASELSGPPELVAAVEASLADCRIPGPTVLRWTWTFPEPPVNVAGIVRSRGERAPVTTTVIVGERSTRTRRDGRFEMRNVAPGSWDVRIADPEWRLPEVPSLEVTPGVRSDLELWVLPDRAPVDELVVTYDRAGQAGVVHTVGIEQARGVPGTLGDPLRALTSQPGLTRAPYDAGWLLVRGGEFDEVGLFLDGVRVPLVYHLGGFTSILHPEMIEAVRFWPGVFPARYGGAISGAVDMVARPVGDRARLVAGVNVVFANAYAEVPTPWGGIAVAARRSYLDGVLALVLDPEAARIAPRFWDVSSRVTVGRSSFTVIGMQDAIDAPSFSGEGILTIAQEAAQVQGVIPMGPVVTVRPWLAWTRREVTGDVTPQIVDELYPGLRIEARSVPTAPARLHAGVEVQRHRFRLERDEVERIGSVWNTDPYAGLAVGGPVEGWAEARLLASVVEASDQQPFRHAVSPRAGVRFRPTDGLLVHGEWGRLHQLPTPTLMLAVAEGAYLGLEESDQFTVGTQIARGPLAFDLDGWERRSAGLAELELDGSIGEAMARAWGFESRGQLRIGGFDGSVLYQHTRSEKREDTDDPWSPSPFEAPHRFEVVAIQKLPRAVTISGRFRFTSGYPRLLEGNTLVPTEAYDLLRQTTIPIEFRPGQERLAPFHALDLRVGRLFAFRRWQLEASLDVQNVYSRRVVEPVITGFGESRPSYGFGLPVLPIFSLDGKWWPGSD